MWIAIGAIACALLALSLLIDTRTFARWFAHPAQSNPELTEQGAALWRIMLAVTAAVLAGASVFWWRFAKPNAAVSSEAVLGRERLWGLIGIIAIALAARATRLSESLWYDEIASWMTYAGGATSIGAVIGNFFDPINHPLHTLLNFLSVRWFADSLGVELAFRLPALIFSTLSVLAMFGLARATIGERAAFIAATLAAVLPVAVLEGVEARGYSMVVFFSAMMTWMLIEAIRRDRPLPWLMYAVFCALGVWSHFVTAFVPIGHAVWIGWRAVRLSERRAAVNASAALALAATLAITLYAPMIPGRLAARGMFAAQRGDQPTIVGVEGFHALLQLGGSWYWWAALPGLLLGTIGLFNRARSISSRRLPHAIEAAMMGLPLMVIAVALVGTWVYARFTFFALPGAILLIAAGIDSAWGWRRLAGFTALGVIIAASVADLAIRPPKQPLRDAVEFVQSHQSPGDRVVAVGLAHEVLRVYAGGLNLTYSLRHGADLPQKLTRIEPAWLIVEYPRSVSQETCEVIQRAGFRETAQLHGWVDWTNGDIVVYHRVD